MDETTRQRNRRSASQREREESGVISRGRPRVSPKSIWAIINHIGSNPKVSTGRCSLSKSTEATSEFTKQLVSSKVEEKNIGSNSDIMKFRKKSSPLAKVSDSFPKSSPTIVRKKNQVKLECIPLPGEEFIETTAQPTNRKLVTCTNTSASAGEVEKFIRDKSTFPARHNSQKNVEEFNKEKSSVCESYIPTDKQCNISGTSSVGSCDLPEHVLEEDNGLPDDSFAWQDSELVNEHSHVNAMPVFHQRSNIRNDIRKNNMSTYFSTECANDETSYSYQDNSIPETQFSDYKEGSKHQTNEESTDSSQVPVQIINYLNFQNPPPTLEAYPNFQYPPPTAEGYLSFQTPPPTTGSYTNFETPPPTAGNYTNFQTTTPTAEGSWHIPSSSRIVSLPAKECINRSTVCGALGPTHSRLRSWNHPSKSFNQGNQKQREVTNNLIRVSDCRKPEESVKQDYSNDTMPDSGNVLSCSPVNCSDHQRYSSYDTIGGRARASLKDANTRRSFERLPQDRRKKWMMSRASSLESVTSPQNQFLESPCFHHLSPDMVNHHALRQRNYGAYYSPGGRGETSGYSPFSSPYNSRTLSPLYLLPPLYLPFQEPDDPLEPNMKGHQLLGDSQLLRFARRVLGKFCRSSDRLRYLGLCVSGQTIQELLQKIKAKFYPVGDKIMLMIGTNNFLQNHCVDDIISAWDELVSHLLCVQSRRLLLLTVPPIPRLANSESYWEELDQVNTFIRGYAGGSKDVVTVADISSLFLSGPRQCCEDYFERTYGDSERIDLIHLNERGFTRLRDFLTDNDML